MHSRSRSVQTFGEALIASVALAGMLYSISLDQLNTLSDLRLFIAVLLVTVVFYFALLFCRMLHYWMTTGAQDAAHQYDCGCSPGCECRKIDLPLKSAVVTKTVKR